MIRCYNTEVVVDSDKASSTELTTWNHTPDVDQSVVWFSERRRRITSSNVRSIAKQKSTTPIASLVSQLLYSTFWGNSATRWGLEQEQHSVGVYKSRLRDRGSPNSIINIKCGLVVGTAHPWLAATPDGWVSDPSDSPPWGLAEFKNLYSYRDLTVKDAITAKKCDCLTFNNSHITPKRTHSFYYQVATNGDVLHEDQVVQLPSSHHCWLSLWIRSARRIFLWCSSPDFATILHSGHLARTHLEGQADSGAKGLACRRRNFSSRDGRAHRLRKYIQ